MEKFAQTIENFPHTVNQAILFQERAEAFQLREAPLLSEEDYQALRKTVLEGIERDSSQNPYHTRLHTEEVEKRFFRLAQEARLSSSVAQAGGIAALLHDYGHSGQTLRQKVSREIAHKDISNEEFSAIAADEILKSRLDPEQIIAIEVAILGTSFGQAEGPYARSYKPLSSMDKLLAFADIAGFTKGFHAWMKESMNVFREMPLKNLPQDFSALVKDRKGFVGFIKMKLDEIAPLIGEAAAAQYADQLNAIKEALDSEEVNRWQVEYEAIQSAAL